MVRYSKFESLLIDEEIVLLLSIVDCPCFDESC
jgi:hypothetical protein